MKTMLTPIDDALTMLLSEMRVITGSEDVGLRDVVNRVSAQPITAPVDVPASDNSAMDGYAVQVADLGAIPATLPVSQRIAAGSTGTALQSGTVARIFTGAPLPPGANAVVMQENCEVLSASVRVKQAVVVGENVRSRGEDIKQGTLLFPLGHRFRVQDMGTLAASGIATLSVRQRLKVGVVTTGNELVQPGTLLAAGQIYNSNFYSIASLLTALGMEVIDFGIVADDLDATVNSLATAAREADCIISSGGVSVGEEDHVKTAVMQLGKLNLWKIAIKPGKPFAYGLVQDRPFFGLPGNPVSAFITFVLLVRPALLALSGAQPGSTICYRLPAGFSLPITGERQEYLRVVTNIESGTVAKLVPYASQSSAAGTSLSVADGLAVVPPFTSVKEGDMLNFIPINELVS